MRIVEIIDSLNTKNIGGAELFYSSLCEEFSKKEIDLYCVVLYDGLDSSVLKNIDSSKVFFCHKHSKYDFMCARRLKKILSKLNPDIVHIHKTVFTYFLAFGYKKPKWKTFFTIHTLPQRSGNFLTRWSIKKLIKKNMHLIGISNQISLEIQKMYNVSTTTINNGIKIINYGSTSKKYDFVCAARFVPLKNHNTLIKVFSLFNIIHPGSKLLLLGDGPSFEECKKYINENNLSNSVVFKGKVNNVQQYLEESRCFVLCSFAEGNPISVLEAMAHGLVLAVSNVGGIPDIVENGINGFLFNPNKEKEILDCIERAFSASNNDAIKNVNIKKGARYSISNCCDQHLELFMKDCL